MDNERYRKGAHTVLDLKYHFVWKTKYGHQVLRREIGLRTREVLQEICMPIRFAPKDYLTAAF